MERYYICVCKGSSLYGLLYFPIFVLHEIDLFIDIAEFEACSEEGAVRLTGSSENTAGRLELCHEGRWGIICDRKITNAISDVVCKQLGHSALGIIIL